MRASELTAPALDWAVAKCEGVLIMQGGRVALMGNQLWTNNDDGESIRYLPSTDWSQGGPIIAQHISLLEDLGDYEWEATAVGGFKSRGDTVLQAVCRTYVLQQLGDEVEIPEELK